MGLICCCQIIEIIPQEFKVIPLAACGYGESEMSNIGVNNAATLYTVDESIKRETKLTDFRSTVVNFISHK